MAWLERIEGVLARGWQALGLGANVALLLIMLGVSADAVLRYALNRPVAGTLEGVAKDRLVQTMKDFKSGARPATLMHQISKGYTEQQMELIAAYFSKQKAK